MNDRTTRERSHTSVRLSCERRVEMVINYDDKEVHHLPLVETFPPATNSYWRMVLKKDEEK